MTASSAPRDSVGHGTPRELWEIIKRLLFEASGLRYHFGLNLESFLRPYRLNGILITSGGVTIWELWRSCEIMETEPLQQDQLISELCCPVVTM